MLKLYGGGRSRATIVQWYLEELGLPYEFVLLDMATGEHRQPAFLAINPIGKVPAILDGDFALWESGAILLYLAEKYGTPSPSLEERALLNQWIVYANATMGPGIFTQATREAEFPRHMAMLNQLFGQRAHLVGDRFTVADVAVGSMLVYTQMLLKLEFDGYPAVAEYAHRMLQRPAYQTALSYRH
jgi:glutathione S-transferase